MKIRLKIWTILIFTGTQLFGQKSIDSLFKQQDYEIGKFIGMNSNSIRSQLGDPYKTLTEDSVKMLVVHVYKVPFGFDTICVQIHYDARFSCRGVTYKVDYSKDSLVINDLVSRYKKYEDYYITPNRYLVSLESIDDKYLFLKYRTTIYPLLLAQLDELVELSQQALNGNASFYIPKIEYRITSLNKTILAAATTNNVTQKELETLKMIYQPYSQLLNFNGMKITYLRHNQYVYINQIPKEISSLKHTNLIEVNFEELENLIEL